MLKQQRQSTDSAPNEPTSPPGLCGKYHSNGDKQLSISSKEHQIMKYILFSQNIQIMKFW